ncbi:hypothetical protein KAMFAM_122 [Bacillus phage Kamfam]|nr:hypothetical protein OTK52_120 [Bacillus phage OTooleKemple52]AXQ67210.1 hypothetical protein KAMFAM_122 [Bacillus phage Kamfam]
MIRDIKKIEEEFKYTVKVLREELVPDGYDPKDEEQIQYVSGQVYAFFQVLHLFYHGEMLYIFNDDDVNRLLEEIE